MTPLDMVISRLQSANCDPSATGRDAYESRCPVHSGKRKNLSISVGDDGRVLLHCHHSDGNGAPSCTADAIAAALGLRMEDLFPSRSSQTPRVSFKTRATNKPSWPTPEDALRAVASKLGPKPVKTQSWSWPDANGNVVMVTARFDTADGEKTYRPVHCQADGSWAIGDSPGLLPLYNLPELADASGTAIVEGEKCADALDAIEYVVTTSAHGAKSPDKTDWTPLAGKDLGIVPDNDAPGEGYAQSLLRIFKWLTPRPTVRIIRLPGLAEGEDIADWLPGLMAGRSGEDAVNHARSEYERLWNDAPLIDLDTVDDAPASEAPPLAIDDDDSQPLNVTPWPNPPTDEAYYGLLGSLVRKIEPHTECDPLALLAHLIVFFGNIIGRSAYVLVESTRHYLNEYIMTVGKTAVGRKGTAGDWAREIFARIDGVWAADRVQAGLSSGEGLISAVRDPTESRSPIRQKGKIIDWQTVVTDPGISDKRLLVLETEFGGALRAIEREGNKLSALIRLVWDRGSLKTLTKIPHVATDAHVSIVGHITLDELKLLLTTVDIANGFANRFWWFAVRRQRSLPFGGTPPDLQAGCDALAMAVEFARTVDRINWSHEARNLWAGGMYEGLVPTEHGPLAAATSRGQPHVLRVAAIFALTDGLAVIDKCHLRAAKALWDASARCAHYIFGESLGDTNAEKILNALNDAAPAGLTRTEIQASVFRRHLPGPRIKAALTLLIERGLVREVQEQTGGRSAYRYIWGGSAKKAN